MFNEMVTKRSPDTKESVLRHAINEEHLTIIQNRAKIESTSTRHSQVSYQSGVRLFTEVSLLLRATG